MLVSKCVPIIIQVFKYYKGAMEQDFSDDIIEQSVAFDAKLDAYQAYQRQKFIPDEKQPLELMSIDVAATANKKFMCDQVQNGEEKIKREYFVKEPLLQIYCATKHGDSVCVNIRNFTPYFIVSQPIGFDDTQQNFEILRKGINEQMKDCPVAVTKITAVRKVNIRYYKPDSVMDQEKYMRVQTISQAVIPQIRKMFESGLFVRGINLPRQTFQSNIPYLLRFMIDKDIVGMGWFRVHKFDVVPDKRKITRCQAQIQCSVHDIEAISSEGQYAKIAPLRILSFDIQCAAEKGFPSAQKDPIIQIACVCKTTNKQIEDYKVVFVLDGASPISGVHVKQMKTQKQMLQDFQKLIITYDPDFIIGYNMINFDLKYCLDRAKALKMWRYGYFGRNLTQISRLRSGKFQSKAMGMRDTFQVNTDGRIQLDLLMHMHRQHKLTSYRLNNVSFHFLGTQKEDVHHTQIYKLHYGSKDDRRRLAIYCLKDAQLPLMLMQKLCCLYNYCQMARVTGVTINFLLTRGQQIKVVSQLLRKAKEHNYIMPTQKVQNSDSGIGFEGAYVLDPIPGFYEQPIATLDFASLYPSIMRAHNLCYTTLIHKVDLERFNLTPDDVFVTSQNQYFVKNRVKPGLLPQILKQLITARKKAKKQLAETDDPMLQKVLDGRQLALKISANSVYGFTGATVGQLPCLQISSSVTLIGRQMIEKTKNLVIKNFNAEVIYGDTDSVMVKFPLKTDIKNRTEQIQQSMELGRQAAKIITKQFDDPIKLQFEKVYCPYLLIAKKRYAGVYYTRSDKHDKVDKKGIQTVRRDNCPLVREMLETVLDTVLCKNNIPKAVEYIKKTIKKLLTNKIDISQLVITKAISKGTSQIGDNKDEKAKKNTYKSKQAHTELAEKMRKRDENVDINIGDRIPYVIILGAKGSRNYENAEDPIKVLEEDLPIDYDYYINKQIKPPLERLLKNTKIITNFDMLFSGDHTRVRYTPKLNNASALGSFLKKKTCCINCRQPTTGAVCDQCQQTDIQIFTKKQLEYLKLKQQFKNMLIQCQKCERTDINEVICANFDCPIFYRRIKVRNQVEEIQKQLARFDTDCEW